MTPAQAPPRNSRKKRTPAIFNPATRCRWLARFALLAVPARAAEAPKILSRDHFVEVRSTVPAIAGHTVARHDILGRLIYNKWEERAV